MTGLGAVGEHGRVDAVVAPIVIRHAKLRNGLHVACRGSAGSQKVWLVLGKKRGDEVVISCCWSTHLGAGAIGA